MATPFATSRPATPPAPQNMPGAIPLPGPNPTPPAPTTITAANLVGGADAEGVGGNKPPVPGATPTATGCFHVDVRLNTIQFEYDPTCPSQIGQEQLDLMAQIKKTESVLTAIFYPEGLPPDLKLRMPAKRITTAPTRQPSAAIAAALSDAHRSAKAQVDEEQSAYDAQMRKVADNPKKEEKRKEEKAEKKKAKFRSYFYALVLLAELGLDGPKGQPWLANGALASLKDQIVTLEAGRVKNGYMRQLGAEGFLLGAVPLAILIARELWRIYDPKSTGYFSTLFESQPMGVVYILLYAWVGAMVGTFLSFAMRNPVLTFDQLGVPESDRLNPSMRLSYVGILAVIVHVALLFGAFKISIGTLDSAKLETTPSLALLIGTFCGISERAISGKLIASADSSGK